MSWTDYSETDNVTPYNEETLSIYRKIVSTWFNKSNNDKEPPVDDIKKAAQEKIESIIPLESISDPSIIGEKTNYEKKVEAKYESKSEIRKKFKIGDVYYLKSKSLYGNTIIKEFVLKKYIYTIKDMRIDILIMKPISGQTSLVSCLTPAECRLFHIKYEPGLQIWPMKLQWNHKKEKTK